MSLIPQNTSTFTEVPGLKGTLLSFSSSVDTFLKAQPLQPKKEVADFIEEAGILVPKRFGSLYDAIKFIKLGGKVIIRSEHPQEYSGAEGILESFILDQELLSQSHKGINWEEFFSNKYIDPEEIKRYFLQICNDIEDISEEEFISRLKSLNIHFAKNFCDVLSISTDDFLENTSFSYWEYIPGINVTAIEDSSVKGKYNIFFDESGKTYHITYENGRISINSGEIPYYLIDQLVPIIKRYEDIRNIDCFDKNNCPSIELQIGKQGIYFLQYHRNRDFEIADFEISDDEIEGKNQIHFVRGITPREGSVIKVENNSYQEKLIYPQGINMGFEYCGLGSREFNTIMGKLVYCVIDSNENFVSSGHLFRSLLSSPNIFIAIEGNVKVNYIRVFSDGKRAYYEHL